MLINCPGLIAIQTFYEKIRVIETVLPIPTKEHNHLNFAGTGNCLVQKSIV